MKLTAMQEEIASAPVDSRLLVLASPGTGKTHTVISRLYHLIGVQGLMPHSEVLVLSFTRAAVGEIRSRLGRLMEADMAVDDIKFLNVRTFDSFATLLILTADPETDLSGTDYDTRIRMATRLLQDAWSVASRTLKRVRHVIVDEIQDLVNVRASLVDAVLERTGGGFTLLGDPAQAIFDYLADAHGDGPNSHEFLAGLWERWGGRMKEISLEEDFRSQTEAAQVAARVRSLILADRNPENDPYVALRNVIAGLPSAGSAREPGPELKPSAGHKTAVLCRTNAEVLHVAAWLRRAGIACIVPPTVEERGLPAWPARVLSGSRQRRISKAAFMEKWAELIGDEHVPGPGEAWGILKAVEDTDLRDLDIRRLSNRLRRGADWAFDSEAHESESAVLVTTVHRAKGREYDKVVILPPVPLRGSGHKAALDEARVMYVAATRARTSVFRMERTGLPVMYNEKLPSGRERWLGQDRAGAHFFEVGIPGDIELSSFVSKRLFPVCEMSHKIQELIWAHLAPGTIIRVLCGRHIGEYIVAWVNPASGRPVPLATMSGLFGRDLEAFKMRVLPRRRFVPGESLGEVVVMERVTVVLPPFETEVYEPYARSGLCLGLQVRGLLTIN